MMHIHYYFNKLHILGIKIKQHTCGLRGEMAAELTGLSVLYVFIWSNEYVSNNCTNNHMQQTLYCLSRNVK